MGFYSSSRLYQESFSDVPEVTLEQVIQDPNIQPTEQEDLIEASLNIIENIQENQNRFFQHIGIAELDYMEANGEEMIYTEGVLGDIVSTIKSFLMKIWERIKALFKRFIMILDSYSKNDKDFAKKYQKEIFGKSGDMSDFSFKGYKWNIDTGKVSDMCRQTGLLSGHLRKWIETGEYNKTSTEEHQKDIENLKDDIDKHRGDFAQQNKITSGGGSLTEEEFRKELHEYFRGGESEKEELEGKDIDVHTMYNKLIQSNQDRKDVDRVFKENKKIIDQDEKTITRYQNEYAKEAHDKWSDDTKNIDDPATEFPTSTNVTKNISDIIQDPDLIKQSQFGHFDSDGLDKLKELHDYYRNQNNQAGQKFQGNITTMAQIRDVVDYLHSIKAKVTQDHVLLKTFTQQTIGYKGATSKRDLGNRRSKALSIVMRVLSATKSLLIAIDSEFLNAMKERSRQYKACLIAYVHYRPSGESAMHEQSIYNEAAYARFSSPLKGINLF